MANETRRRSHKTLRKRIRRQYAEAAGPDNSWYAGETLGRTPTQKEAIHHYFAHGGSDDYRRRHPC